MGVEQGIGDGFDVRSLSVTYREGHSLAEHAHPWAQLVFARSGLTRVETDEQVWFVPPTRAVWLPSGVRHRLTFRGEVALRTLYLCEQRADVIRRRVQTLEISPLLYHMIEHIQSIGMLDPRIAMHDRLAGVLVDLLRVAPSLDLALPYPQDARAASLAEHLRTHPADRRSLKELAAERGASLRTMQRCFRAQTGLSLDAWRKKSRLVCSYAALAEGRSVSTAAHESGYESPSAFIAAFRKQFGTTPGKVAAGSSQ